MEKSYVSVLLHRNIDAQRGSLMLLLLAAIFLAALTFSRNLTWTNELRLWRDTVKKSPGKSRPWNNLGRALLADAELPRARFAIQRAVQLDPDNFPAQVNLALVWSRLGDLPNARRAAERAVTLRPDSVQAVFIRGEVEREAKDFQAALAWYERAQELSPHHAQVLKRLGETLARLGRKDEALPYLEEAWSHSQGDPELVELLAEARKP